MPDQTSDWHRMDELRARVWERREREERFGEAKEQETAKEIGNKEEGE